MKKINATRRLTDFERPSVTVDLVLLTVRAGALCVLVMRRQEPAAGQWALPGGFVHIEEALEETVARLLRDKAQLPGAFVEQLYTFGEPKRDPRGRVISVAYYALVPAERIERVLVASSDLALARIDAPPDGALPSIVLPDRRSERLAFDHGDIVKMAVARMRGKLDYSAVGLELLPELFTLRQLQEVHEAILGARLAKPAFRRKMLDRGFLKPTGLLEEGAAFRPAELYRRAWERAP
jgi:8-oxo-dGTP diphosphatase